MNNKWAIAAVIGGIILCVVVFIFAPDIKNALEKANTIVQDSEEVDDVDDDDDDDVVVTDDDIREAVGVYCRAMIKAYQADKDLYETYKDGITENTRTWALESKLRANETAVTYNQHIEEYGYLWKEGLPDDLVASLEELQ